ncbi:MAG: carboxypeptidase-like regulatory domain-containing protein [Myxococcota bacterium]|nr:carboxypeptidase-like regulatory domain-containing protein [Myxococcota bacterium]MEC9391442.1 carboxypeptidase-like regulatory domain-containing protein [Myxococcota bacterium]
MVRVFVLALVSWMVGCTEYKLEAGADAFPADDTASDGWGSGSDDTATPSGYDSGIRGRVCDSLGDGWVVGAYVYTTFDTDGDGEHDARVEDSTDIEGRFHLTGLPGGRDYVVNVVKGSFELTFDVSLTSGTYEIPEEECALAPPRIAVISGDYDHIEDIIASMGLEYTLFEGSYYSEDYLNFLRDPAAMAEFDIIFFNCGVNTDWYAYYPDEVRGNIRDFVIAGGSVYASDWAYFFVESSFPAWLTFYGNDAEYGAAQRGVAGTSMARVEDLTMQAIIGEPLAEINFDLDLWVVLESVGPDVDVLLSASVQAYTDMSGLYTSTISEAPIAARFNVGEGRVIYTAFHNEHAATTLDMTDILEEIILSL